MIVAAPMGEVVNLRRARKAKKRASDAAEAAENRVRFGLPAAERRALAEAEARRSALLEGHRRDPKPQDEPA